MKRGLILILCVLAALAAQVNSAAAQGGTLMGVVRAADPVHGEFVAGAEVRLNLFDTAGPGYHAQAVSGDRGLVEINDLPPGLYQAIASLPEIGFASTVVEILANSVSVVELVLDAGEGSGGDQPMVNLTGVVQIEQNPTGFTGYFLSVGLNAEPAYRLILGPSGYVPWEPIALPPADGDTVVVLGRLFGYGGPPMVIAYIFDRTPWRDPELPGHGGSGGGLYEWLACDTSLIRIEVIGTVNVVSGPPETAYQLQADPLQTYYLDFGGEEYDPEGPAMRPESGQMVHIVGGLTDCIQSDHSRILVYEINGEFWRVPGDTSGFGALPVTPRPDYVPVTHLVATNYPNPFNALTTIEFSLPQAGPVRVAVFDLQGREVAVLEDRPLMPGRYAVTWNGAEHASGLYFFEVRSGTQRVVGRMALLK